MEFGICSLKETTREGLKSRAAPSKAPAVQPDIIFIPGTCMDSLGNRLGRGMGFYDRYLTKFSNARRIGTIHSRFVVEEFSNNWIEEHDQTLEVLWTESGIYQTPNFRLHKNKERTS
jgi:5-formyltetrahydrofolate cyclo-ligase